MANVTNVKIGACSVKYNGVDLGHTKGGVTVTYSPEYADITVDQYGNTPVDKALVGETLTVKVPLAESTIANLKVAMPLGTEAGATNGRLTVGKEAGERLLSQSAELVLHPLYNDASDLSEDVVIYKAVVSGEVELGYKVDEERVFEVEFTALVDTSKSSGSLLGHIGDSTD